MQCIHAMLAEWEEQESLLFFFRFGSLNIFSKMVIHSASIVNLCSLQIVTAILQSLQISSSLSWQAWGHVSVVIKWSQFVWTPFWHALHPRGSLVNTEWDWLHHDCLHCLHSLLTAYVSLRRNPAVDFYQLWCSSGLPLVCMSGPLMDLKPCLHQTWCCLNI